MIIILKRISMKFEKVWREGQSMTLEDAVELALEEGE
jgi:hypothetical protein